MGFYIKDAREIAGMRQAGHIVAATLDRIAPEVKVGVSLTQLERICRDFIVAHDAEPAFLGYKGFPGAVCISVNDQVVHGIPNGRRVADGDLVKVDVGVRKDGLYGDGARTYVVGTIPPRTRELVDTTEQALCLGIEQARAGRKLGDISWAVQSFVESHGFSCVRELSGHGVGIQLHEEPAVPNFGKAGHGARLVAGLTLAIEPMINMGTYDVRTEANEWTVVTKDGQLSAHFEHTILVTDGPAEILTK